MTTKRQNRVTTIIIIIVASLFLSLAFSLVSNAKEPFAGNTKHEKVKRMTKRQVKKASKGKTFYYRTKSGKLKKRR